jgi:lysozyme
MILDEALNIALSLCKKWEGCELSAYWDDLGRVWTIGYGATGNGITEGTIWSQEQANDDLKNRLYPLINSLYGSIDQCVALNSNELGALGSLAYNVGLQAILKSSLLASFNEGNIQQAAADFLQWDHAGGQEVQGLLNRRQDEERVFLGGSP